MDYDALRFWFSVGQTLITAVIGGYVWVVTRHRVTIDRITEFETELDTRLDRHGDRLTRIEQEIKHSPTADDYARIWQRLDELGQELSALKGEFKGASQTLTLIHQYLMGQKK